SSGKSSVLESLVGRDLLPRGDGRSDAPPADPAAGARGPGGAQENPPGERWL
ncbi:hypothetical protein AAFF_G00243490, partial [Aldrovandia affinis]